jgi:DNA-binding HxlR family transcriptional regulator
LVIDYLYHISYDFHSINFQSGGSYMSGKSDSACSENCPCSEECPLAHALAMLSGKWKMRILCGLLADGTLRYNEISKRLGSITPAVLSASLKELEADGLITRTVFPDTPVRVEYSLTDRGQQLRPILHRLAHWSLEQPYDSEGGEDKKNG